MPDTRGEKELIRQWRLLALLAVSRFPQKRADLAAHFGVSKKTIGRDLGDLQQVGFRLRREKKGQTETVSLDPTFKAPPPIPLTVGEMAALHLARAQVAHLAAGLAETELVSAFEKIEAAIPPEVRELCDRLAAHQVAHVRGQPKQVASPEVLAELRDAIVAAKLCVVRYRPRRRTATVELRLAPQALISHRGGLYVVSWSLERRAFRTLAAELVRGVEVLEKIVPRRSPEQIEAEYGKAFGLYTGKPFELRLRFKPELAEHIEARQWHPSERTRRARNGSILYTAEIAGAQEVRAWILGFGAGAEVLGPAWLRKQVEASLATALAQYRDAR